MRRETASRRTSSESTQCDVISHPGKKVRHLKIWRPAPKSLNQEENNYRREFLAEKPASAVVRKKTTEPAQASAQRRLGFRSVFSREIQPKLHQPRFFCFFSSKEKKREKLPLNKILVKQFTTPPPAHQKQSAHSPATLSPPLHASPSGAKYASSKLSSALIRQSTRAPVPM